MDRLLPQACFPPAWSHSGLLHVCFLHIQLYRPTKKRKKEKRRRQAGGINPQPAPLSYARRTGRGAVMAAAAVSAAAEQQQGLTSHDAHRWGPTVECVSCLAVCVR